MQMTSCKELKQLENTVLLDRLVLSGIRVVSIRDIEYLSKRGFLCDNHSPVKYITQSGQEFSNLMISDEQFGILKVGTCFKEKRRINFGKLEMNVKRCNGNNLICNTVEEYKNQLRAITDLVDEKYGIIVDVSDVTIKQIEINRTFHLEYPFKMYRRPLLTIFSNLPPKSGLVKQMDYKNLCNGYMEYETFYATSKRGSKSKFYKTLVIYNKSKAIGLEDDSMVDYMRVELKLIGTRKVTKELGTNKFGDISDELVQGYFCNQMEKLIITPYEKWMVQRDKEVLKLILEQRKRDIRHWITNTLRILLDKENGAGYIPVILDVEDMLPLVDKIGVNKSQQRYKIRQTMIRQAQKYEQTFCNNDHKRIIELISKLSTIK